MRLRRDTPFRVVRVEPPDGARGVFRDDPIVLLLSGPVDADRLHEAIVEVGEGDESVLTHVESLDGGRALVLRPTRPLNPGREHRLRVRGLRDPRGQEAAPVETSFTTGPLSGRELRSREDAAHWPLAVSD